MSSAPESTPNTPDRSDREPPSPAEELRKRRLIDAAREQAKLPSNAETETHRGCDSDTGSGRLEVRCPSCHTPIEVAVDTQLTNLTCSACGSHFSLVDQSQATAMAPALAKMGRFELIERIGVGGFGSVWKARDKRLDRTVAVKIPRQGAMNGEEQEKFFREARAAAQLKHPSIVSVHEVGRDGDSIYIVSDYVRGVTLGDWLTGQQLTSREAAELCAKIADALHHAHEHGVVHRDLKPANIMIDGDGEPHLMDFGLARREAGEITITLEGHIMGTPAYMSPEQAAGEGHTADRRSDIYSLGVILFQLLTGELPFRGNLQMLVHQAINDPAPSPRKFNARIARDLETITLKCLEKEPSRRYETARDLADELLRYIAGKPIKARPIGRSQKAWRWCKRNPAIAALSGAMLTLLVVVAVIGSAVGLREAHLRQIAEQQNDELKVQLTHNLVEQGNSRYESGRIDDAIALISSAYSTAPAKSPLRTSARNLMAGWGHGRGRLLLHDNDVQTAQFGPTNGTVVTQAHDETLLWDARTGRLLRRQHVDLDNGWLVLSQDGRIAAVVGGRYSRPGVGGFTRQKIRFFDVQASRPIGDPIELAESETVSVEAIASTPEGRALFSIDAEGLDDDNHSIALWDIRAGKYVWRRKRASAISSVALSADNRTVVTGHYDHTARIWDLQTGDLVCPALQHDHEILAVAYSPDSQTVATGSRDHTARLWEARTGKSVGRRMKHDGSVLSLAFTSDGLTLATGSSDETARLWAAKTGVSLAAPIRHEAPVQSISFSPDGGTVLTRNGRTVRLWNAETGKAASIPLHHSEPVKIASFSPDSQMILTVSGQTARLWYISDVQFANPLRHSDSIITLSFSPDSRKVVTGSSDQTAQLWDVATSKRLGRPLPHKGVVCATAFTPDGRTLITATPEMYWLWDARTGELLGGPTRHGRRPGSRMGVAFSPDRQKILSLWGDASRLTDVRTGTGKLLEASPRFARYNDFSRDGRTLLTANVDTMRLYDAQSGEPRSKPLRITNDWLRNNSCIAAFSPNSRAILTVGSIAQLWDRSSLSLPAKQFGRCSFAVISPNGRTVLTCANERERSQLWNVQTCNPIGDPLLHEGRISAAAFTPDGRTVITGSEAGLVRMWDAITGRPLGPSLPCSGDFTAYRDVFLAHSGLTPGGSALKSPITIVAISPDGRTVAAGDKNGFAHLWPVPQLPPNDPAVISAWGKFHSGAERNEEGYLRPIAQKAWLEAYETLEKLGAEEPKGLEQIQDSNSQALPKDEAHDSDAQSPHYTIDSGLVGYWSFDEGSGDTAHDQTGHGLDGHLIAEDSARCWSQDVPPVAGNRFSLKLENTHQIRAYVLICDDHRLDLRDEFTVSMWAKATKNFSGQPHILDKDSKDGGYALSFDNDTRAAFAVSTDSQMGKLENSVSSRKPLFDDAWHHVVGVFESGAMRLFVDRKMIEEKTSSNAKPHSNSAPLLIGKRSTRWVKHFNPQSFQGLIDEVRIYNRALSEHEIRNLVGTGQHQPQTATILGD